MAPSRVPLVLKTPKTAIWAVVILAALAALGYAILVPADPLRVQLLDVSGYTDDVNIWMPFRVNLGLTNTGRDLVRIRRVHVEPDFDDFNEAYNVGTYELDPPLVVEPGNSLTYQAAVTLLNATQLQPGSASGGAAGAHRAERRRSRVRVPRRVRSFAGSGATSHSILVATLLFRLSRKPQAPGPSALPAEGEANGT